jgi:pimeloyl-ACP methyl ester carboxylesterase
MTFDEKTISVNGRSVRYWQDGVANSRVLLLLHGGIGDAHLNWSPGAPALVEHFRVIAPDLPGFGATAALPTMSVESLLEWIKQFLDALGIEQVALGGHAFGALLARLFAAAYPPYVVALIMVNGGTIPNIPPVIRVLARIPLIGRSVFYLLARSTVSPNELARLVRAQGVLNDEFAAQVRANLPGFAAMMRLLAVHPMPQKRTPPVPTLLLWGADDEIVTLKEAERIKGTLGDAMLSPIADCANMPHVEASEVFAWQVIQFIETRNRPSKPDLPGVGKLRG